MISELIVLKMEAFSHSQNIVNDAEMAEGKYFSNSSQAGNVDWSDMSLWVSLKSLKKWWKNEKPM